MEDGTAQKRQGLRASQKPSLKQQGFTMIQVPVSAFCCTLQLTQSFCRSCTLIGISSSTFQHVFRALGSFAETKGVPLGRPLVLADVASAKPLEISLPEKVFSCFP